MRVWVGCVQAAPVETKLSTWLTTPLFAGGLDSEDLLTAGEAAAATPGAPSRAAGRVPKLLRTCFRVIDLIDWCCVAFGAARC